MIDVMRIEPREILAFAKNKECASKCRRLSSPRNWQSAVHVGFSAGIWRDVKISALQQDVAQDCCARDLLNDVGIQKVRVEMSNYEFQREQNMKAFMSFC